VVNKTALTKGISFRSNVYHAFGEALKKKHILAYCCNMLLNSLYFFYKKIQEKKHRFKSGKKYALPFQEEYGATQRLGTLKFCLIAELSIPQCTHYRVEQRAEQLAQLGYSSQIVSWTQEDLARDAMQDAVAVIFYRVPFFEGVQGLYKEARRLALPVLFEIDDLVFDLDKYAANSNLEYLSKAEQRVLLDGVLHYRNALLAADLVIVSTDALARSVEALGKPVHVVHNALSEGIIQLSEDIPITRRTGRVSIYYGSGSNTHNEDFLECSEGLIQVLAARDDVDLFIHGALEIPKPLMRYSERIYRVGNIAVEDYYRAIGSYDIALCPLQPSIFNDAKSNIKYLEASIFSTPAVCSPVAEFSAAIEHGKNGFLARSSEEWKECLLRLVDDPSLRKEMGDAARASVLDTYAGTVVAKDELKACVDSLALPNDVCDVLLVNILFGKNSFGGATYVVEALASELTQEGLKVCVFTTIQDSNLPEYSLVRYNHGDVQVFSVVTHSIRSDVDYDPEIARVFSRVLSGLSCSRVHFHSIQHLGTGLVDICQEHALSYWITIHDAWWWCPRQFMLDSDGLFCAQQEVLPAICQERCGYAASFLYSRKFRMESALARASGVMTPSNFFTNLASANLPQGLVVKTNKNGIFLPASHQGEGSASAQLTFAYVGGKAAHKGYFFLQDGFNGLEKSNYRLLLPDVHRSLGTTELNTSGWRHKDTIDVVEPYSSDTIDSFFALVDVLIFPSLWDESFGLTVREAIARNVFVITSDCGGPSECIEHGVNGLVFPKGDIKAFQDCLKFIFENEEMIRAYKTKQYGDIRTYKEQALELISIFEGNENE
jgi:glycosyltransferase involved in cell wall biosynthesis